MGKILKLIRKNITVGLTNFEFDITGYEFLVKNFNDFDIFVCFEESSDTSKMIKIPARTAQVFIINKGTELQNASSKIYVFSNSAGEVEVQCVRF